MESRSTRSSQRETDARSSQTSSSRRLQSHDMVGRSNLGYNRSDRTLGSIREGSSSNVYNRSDRTLRSIREGSSSNVYNRSNKTFESTIREGSSSSRYDLTRSIYNSEKNYSGQQQYSNLIEQKTADHAESSKSYVSSFMGFLKSKIISGYKSIYGQRTEQVCSDKSLQVSSTDRGRSFLQTIKPLEGDTTAVFEKRYTNTILRGGDPNLSYPFNYTLRPGDIYTATFVAGRENLLGSYFYRSTIRRTTNQEGAEIDAHTIFKDNDSRFTVERTSPLPASEILWHHYRKAASSYGLPERPSRIRFSTIQNTETEKTLGPYFKAGTSETVFEGSEKYYTIASTPIGKIPFYLTKKHYSDSRISKINITRSDNGDFNDIAFYVEDKEDSDSNET